MDTIKQNYRRAGAIGVGHAVSRRFSFIGELGVGLLSLMAAFVVGAAISIALGLWSDGKMHANPSVSPWGEWKPVALSPFFGNASVTTAQSAATSGPIKLVGLAGEAGEVRAYIQSGGKHYGLKLDEALPGGEKLIRIERDAAVLMTGGGEQRLVLLPPLPAPKKPGDSAAPAGSATNATAANPTTASNQNSGAKGGGNNEAVDCRLSAADRKQGTVMQPVVAKALAAERATLLRIFEPVLASSGGIPTGLRAKGTAGTTAAFGIEDGDILQRADGLPVVAVDGLINFVFSKVGAGAAVILDGERKGAPKRWVFMPPGCAAS